MGPVSVWYDSKQTVKRTQNVARGSGTFIFLSILLAAQSQRRDSKQHSYVNRTNPGLFRGPVGRIRNQAHILPTDKLTKPAATMLIIIIINSTDSEKHRTETRSRI